MNFVGIVAALSAFLGIWFGHVAVRKIEFVSPTIWLPRAVFAALGILTEGLSLITDNWLLNTASGILGIILLFGAFEFTRQQRRVRRGHAPANPNNPRHAVLLADPDSNATTLNLLQREPVGHSGGWQTSVKRN